MQAISSSSGLHFLPTGVLGNTGMTYRNDLVHCLVFLTAKTTMDLILHEKAWIPCQSISDDDDRLNGFLRDCTKLKDEKSTIQQT